MKIRPEIDCSALGTFVVTELVAIEAISRAVHARAIVQCESPIDEASLLGEKATLQFSSADGVVRSFALVVLAIEALDTDTGDVTYALELTHKIALLALRRDARVFLNLDVKAIVTRVLTDGGVTDVTWSLDRTLTVRESCAQYRESDLDFVLRLLADEGIFFFYGDDGLQFIDKTSAFTPIPGDEKVPFSDEAQGDVVFAFEVTHTRVSDVVTLKDWNEATPGVDLTSRAIIDDKKTSELFEYPGRYATQDDGQAIAKIRAEEIATRRTHARGESSRAQFRAGCVFELDAPDQPKIALKYALREVEHRIARDEEYRNVFVCAPSSLPYRPARDRVCASVPGAHTAIAAGASGEEIHVDAQGRMKARFAYDRASKEGDLASRFIRVVQPMLGGSMLLARVGWEMAVRYVDGDIDRPIAVARMYDGTHPPPFTLPGAKTTTALQTTSSPNAQHRNAITINDESGSMMFTVLAAKDFDATVENDRKETIGGDETVSVKSDSTTLVGGKQTIAIDGDAKLEVTSDGGVAVASDRSKTISGDEKNTISGKFSIEIGGSDTEDTKGDRSISADKAIAESIQGKRSAQTSGAVKNHAAKDLTVYIGGKSSESIAAASSIQSDDGALSEEIAGDASITVGAAASETVSGKKTSSVGGDTTIDVSAAITIDATGKVQIKGDKITIDASAAANLVGGGAIVSLAPAAITFVGMVTLKGSSGVQITGKPGMNG